MSGFKKLVYIQFYPDAWLNSPELRRLKPEVKGFYIDLLCQLFYCFPYGHCSLINYKKAKRLQNQVNQRVNHVVVNEDNEEDNLWVDLALNFSLVRQLAVVDNLEKELHKYIPYTEAQIIDYIKVLEETRVISRTATGVIYVRRMVKDFKRKVVAYLNGIKGGNPRYKKAKRGQNRGVSKEGKLMKTNESENLVSRGVEPFRSYSLPIGPPGKDKGVSKGEKNEKIEDRVVPEFKLQKLYDLSWEQLNDGHAGDNLPPMMIKGLTEHGFKKWKLFVDWVVENGYQDLWIAKPLSPGDFQKLYFDKKFTEDWWGPTIQKILSTGLEPKHTLFFRIPEFMKHVASNKKSSDTNSMDAGHTNYESQDKW